MDFFGKYRGKVANNVDPQQLGRIQVNVPAVLGDGRLSWALPCMPVAGSNKGFFAVPPKDANVWVEFEGGDPDYPIWTGCFWDVGSKVPAKPAAEQVTMIKTGAATLTLSDLPPDKGGFTLEVTPPAVTVPMSMTFQKDAIELKCGTNSIKVSANAGIELKSTQTVKVTGAAGVRVQGGKSIDLKAGAMKLNAAMVNVNNGALQVT